MFSKQFLNFNRILLNLIIFLLLNVLSSCLLKNAGAAEPDQYEPDNTYAEANIIILGKAEEQQHNFHAAGDEDWVMFYALKNITYTVKALNAATACDAVIELYDTNGTTLKASKDDYKDGEQEILEWQCRADGIYYVRIRNADSSIFGDDTGYYLSIYPPTGPEGGIISGKITNKDSKASINGALLRTTENVTGISEEDGYFLMFHPAGPCTITVEAAGYQTETAEVTVLAGDDVEQNFELIPIGSGNDNETTCIAAKIYGTCSAETEAMRAFRDAVLSKTPAGRQLIKLYYSLSPAIEKSVEKNALIKAGLKAALDVVLLFVKASQRY